MSSSQSSSADETMSVQTTTTATSAEDTDPSDTDPDRVSGSVNGLFSDDGQLQAADDVATDHNPEFIITEKQATDEQISHDTAESETIDTDHLNQSE